MEERKGFYKGLLVASLIFILLIGASYYYVDKTYIQPLKKTGLL